MNRGEWGCGTKKEVAEKKKNGGKGGPSFNPVYFERVVERYAILGGTS